MADLIERASAINALQYVLDSPNYSKALGEILRIPTADTPQTDCNANQCVQRVEYIGDIEKKRCRTCRHFESEFHTPISSDGTYYPYVICTTKECHYESVDTPQTETHDLRTETHECVKQTDCGWAEPK